NHGLERLALVVAAQEQPAVGAEVILHLQHDLEVAVVLLVRDDDAPVARDVLAADDGPVLDRPVAARLVLARPAVPALGADVPALERLAVEDGDVAAVALALFLVLPLGEAAARQRE